MTQDVLAVSLLSSGNSRTKTLYDNWKGSLTSVSSKPSFFEYDLMNPELNQFLGKSDLQGRLQNAPRETRMLLEYDRFVFAFPIWNFGVPAQLKAFIDRAVTPGFTYKFGPQGVESNLEGKSALILCVAGGDYSSQPKPYQSLASILAFLKVKTTEVFVDQMDLVPHDKALACLSMDWQAVNGSFLRGPIHRQ